MKLFVSLLMIVSSCVAYGQNKRITASTSVGYIARGVNINGLGTGGFSTTTSFEYRITERFWLSGVVDFQSISFVRTLPKLEIDGSLTSIPLLIGGRYFFENKSKFRPFVNLSAGIAYMSIPNGNEEITGKVKVFSEDKFPFTYDLGLGIEWKFKPTFFPYLQVDYQTFSNSSNIFSSNIIYIPIRIGVRTYPF